MKHNILPVIGVDINNTLSCTRLSPRSDLFLAAPTTTAHSPLPMHDNRT